MSTFTTRAGSSSSLTSCDSCGELVDPRWRSLAAHTAAHGRLDQLIARQARIDAQTRCNERGFVALPGAESGRMGEQNEAAPGVNLIRPLTRSSDLAERG